jgi:branched-chain amino acid transport system ATP-binding protein
MSLLEVQDAQAGYGLLVAVRDVSLACEAGGVLALVGANGAGKTTLLRSIAGAHPLRSGRIRFDGVDLAGIRAPKRVRMGIALVPEGRRLFGDMSVEENLRVAAAHGRRGPWVLETVLEAFPQLKPKLRAIAGSLSGGQQQAAAIARALMTNPRLLLLDEVSLGLSPLAVDQVYASLEKLRDGGTTIMLVEQDLTRAMGFAQEVVCMLEGRVSLRGSTRELGRESVMQAYFGLRDTPAAQGAPSR